MQRHQSGSSRRRAGYTITTPRQIAALVAPVRQAIVDAVAASGPVSVAELAAQLGRPASGLYHHVQALCAVGLLIAMEAPRPTRGRPGLQFDVPGRPLRIRYAPANTATRGPMRAVVRAMARMAAREFDRGYRPGVRVSGKRRELWASRVEAWLTDRELERVNELLRELFAAFSAFSARGRRGRGRVQLRALTFVLAPLSAQSKRRAV